MLRKPKSKCFTYLLVAGRSLALIRFLAWLFDEVQIHFLPIINYYLLRCRHSQRPTKKTHSLLAGETSFFTHRFTMNSYLYFVHTIAFIIVDAVNFAYRFGPFCFHRFWFLYHNWQLFYYLLLFTDFDWLDRAAMLFICWEFFAGKGV